MVETNFLEDMAIKASDAPKYTGLESANILKGKQQTDKMLDIISARNPDALESTMMDIRDANKLKQRMQKLAKFDSPMKQRTDIQDIYGDMSSEMKRVIEQIDPKIKKINKRQQTLMNVKKPLDTAMMNITGGGITSGFRPLMYGAMAASGNPFTAGAALGIAKMLGPEAQTMRAIKGYNRKKKGLKEIVGKNAKMYSGIDTLLRNIEEEEANR